MTLVLIFSISSPPAAKAGLAIAAVILLSGTLILQAAHAQQQPGSNHKFKVKLPKALDAVDATSKVPSLKNSSAVSDKVTVGDTISKSVIKPTHMTAVTKMSIKDTIQKRVSYAIHKVSRSIFEQVSVGDLAKGPSTVAVVEYLAVSERTLLSGAIVPPFPPQLTITPMEQQKTFHSDRVDSAAITFTSSSTGTYRVDIDDAAGNIVATITGVMVHGENKAKWTGVDLQGKAVPSGTYTYYITAKNDNGVRAAPSGGDGTIVIAGDEGDGDVMADAPPFLGISGSKMPPTELLLTAIAGAASATLLLLFIIVKKRRRKDLVLYLPTDAAPVIENIRQKYPRAKVEDYVSTGEHGAGKRYIGVAIADSKESDDEWILGIVAKAKEIAGVDLINLTYKGKTKSV